jgi:acetyl-CoA C-acetyltransferase
MTELRGGVAIVGIGEVATGRFDDRPALGAAMQAARSAVQDSGLAKSDIDTVITAGAIYSRDFNSDLIFSRLVEELGMTRTVHQNLQVMAGGASGSMMMKAAAGLIHAGLAGNVLCIHADKVGTGVPSGDAIDLFATLGIPDEWERPYGQHFSAIAALITQRYQHETGTTARQLASVCVSLRQWAALNPNAMYRTPLTADEVLNSKMLSEPLHALESNMLADGGSAFVVTSAAKARELTSRPAYLLGWGSRVTHYSVSQEADLSRLGFRAAATDAFRIARLEPSDIDIAEIYDSYPVFCLMALEELGFLDRGQAGAFVAEGNTSPGGRLPMTTNGGMLSQGHTGAGGGVAILVEAARQLMGKAGDRQVQDVRFAVETGTGGSYMDAHVLVLGTEVPA